MYLKWAYNHIKTHRSHKITMFTTIPLNGYTTQLSDSFRTYISYTPINTCIIQKHTTFTQHSREDNTYSTKVIIIKVNYRILGQVFYMLQHMVITQFSYHILQSIKLKKSKVSCYIKQGTKNTVSCHIK